MTSPQWDGVAGKRVVLTGATNGIGLAAAEALAAQGAQLAIVARDQARGEQAAGRARAAAPSPEAAVDVLIADLTTQAEVRRLAASIAARYSAVDVLVNNAGAMFNTRRVTGDGIERTWALNHLAPFLLTSLLLEKLGAAGAARVITTSSDAGDRSHLPFDDLGGERAYKSGTWPAQGFRRYGETKLANIVFTMELARRAQGSGVSAFCYHPGNVATNFNHNNGPLMSLGMALTKPFSRSPAKGAETLLWLAESTDVADQSGGYFFDMKPRDVPPGAKEPGVGSRLWEVSEAQVLA
jgi:NAD(P)-dependent dehydrogenase (short-subunit alcohol dehydrogenase family)